MDDKLKKKINEEIKKELKKIEPKNKPIIYTDPILKDVKDFKPSKIDIFILDYLYKRGIIGNEYIILDELIKQLPKRLISRIKSTDNLDRILWNLREYQLIEARGNRYTLTSEGLLFLKRHRSKSGASKNNKVIGKSTTPRPGGNPNVSSPFVYLPALDKYITNKRSSFRWIAQGIKDIIIFIHNYKWGVIIFLILLLLIVLVLTKKISLIETLDILKSIR